MDINIVVGYLCAVLVGIFMVLLGGGGSVLTIPIFVYLFAIEPLLATSYSLVIVGVIATVGCYKKFKEQAVNLRVGLIFVVPSFIGVYISRRYLLPMMPYELFTIGDFTLTKDLFILLFFSIMMIGASYSMIRTRKQVIKDIELPPYELKIMMLIIQGFVIGILTGFIGAGGGFIIVPVLVILANLDIRVAIGTSLFIIAIKSLVGFLGDVGVLTVSWSFIFVFTCLAIVGILIGNYLSQFIKADHLKKMFGWFILLFGISMILKELT